MCAARRATANSQLETEVRFRIAPACRASTRNVACACVLDVVVILECLPAHPKNHRPMPLNDRRKRELSSGTSASQELVN